MTMVSRRRMMMVMAAATSIGAPAYAQEVMHIARDAPERMAILDVARIPVERRLGIKVVFVVERMTLFGDWAYAAMHPRDAAGNRIDYRRTLFAKDFDPEQDAGRRGLPADRRLLGGMGDEIQAATRDVFDRI